MTDGSWVVVCIFVGLAGISGGVAISNHKAEIKPYEPTGLVQRQEVGMKMVEQTDRLIAILERKCLPEEP